MTTESLSDLMLEVLRTGQRKKLTEEAKQSFYLDFYERVSPKIEEIRAKQRQAYEENKGLTLR